MKVISIAVLFSLICCAGAGADSPQTDHFDPTLPRCEALARQASDAVTLRSRSSEELNDLDWRLSVCEGKFVPLKPAGVTLVLEAHGNVADTLRMRLEKAIRTLPPEGQAAVWAAFRASENN